LQTLLLIRKKAEAGALLENLTKKAGARAGLHRVAR
jgi:hypothetical protein